MPTKRILVIDDEKNLCTVIAVSLEKIARWQVLIAQSGSEGLKRAETERPDAILLDVMMPDMDGLELFALLQSRPVTAKVPVIVLSAKVQKVDLSQFAQLGFAGMIAKPFDPLKLPYQVAELLKWN
ncbi:response regulator [Scytonema sp. NUACC21]